MQNNATGARQNRERERDAPACIRSHEAYTLPPVCGVCGQVHWYIGTLRSNGHLPNAVSPSHGSRRYYAEWIPGSAPHYRRWYHMLGPIGQFGYIPWVKCPQQSCKQSVSAPRGKAGARLNAHTELRAKRQRLARKAIYRNRPIVNNTRRH
jgi:hypothetical protein